MNRIDPRTRFAALLLVVALLSSLAVAVARVRVEQSHRRVEIAMDYNDFLALAHSYDYNPESFLIQLRRAGLTSLALTEQLGASLTGNTATDAVAISGATLLDTARISPIANHTLARLVREGAVRSGSMYILAYDAATYKRLMQQLPLHFEPRSIRVLHATPPYAIAVRTQSDYFNTTALGIPQEQVQLARRLGFFVIPRFQNDERLKDGEIDRMFADLHAGKWVSTVVFFGLRNQVLGFPDHLPDTAAVFLAHKQMNYGEIETYDASQVQKGNVALARLIPGHIVRVQAITKLELDKLAIPQIVARYDLGVRERNIRVVYLRPFAHEDRGLSIEATNVEMVREIAQELRDHGFRLGRATPIPQYRGNNRVLVGLAALAVPSIFVLLLGWYGWYRPSWSIVAYAATVGLYLGGLFTHHDLVARSVIALCGAVLFAAGAFTAISGAFYEEPEGLVGRQIAASLIWTLVGTVTALLGALTVVGIMSAPLIMEEVEPFRGVKLVLALPPLIALVLYLFTDRFNNGIADRREVLASPIRIYQLIVAVLILGIGALVLMRSGNSSDIAPSGIELTLRHHLTQWLSVRPRFKEFLVGFPFMMLLPALGVAHRRIVGPILVLGIGVGLGDIIDTFSHLHTPIVISLFRIFNGFVIGAIVGAILIGIYRYAVLRVPAPSRSRAHSA